MWEICEISSFICFVIYVLTQTLKIITTFWCRGAHTGAGVRNCTHDQMGCLWWWVNLFSDEHVLTGFLSSPWIIRNEWQSVDIWR